MTRKTKLSAHPAIDAYANGEVLHPTVVGTLHAGSDDEMTLVDFGSPELNRELVALKRKYTGKPYDSFVSKKHGGEVALPNEMNNSEIAIARFASFASSQAFEDDANVLNVGDTKHADSCAEAPVQGRFDDNLRASDWVEPARCRCPGVGVFGTRGGVCAQVRAVA